jgi:hypothetical protein
MDYLDVADEPSSAFRRRKLTPISRRRRGPNHRRKQNAPIWVRKIASRPWSASAKDTCRIEADFYRAESAAGNGLGGGSESSFDRRAESPAGAAGLFPIDARTAKRSDFPLAARSTISTEASATASARYLKYLHDRFQDWRLVLAAYNSGEGTVQKLLGRYKTRNYDIIAGHLPAKR